jgi:hypothetical protein
MSEAETTVGDDAPASPRFANEAGRTERIDLDWPVIFDGKTYDHIIARRMTASEVADFVEEVRAMPEGERNRARLPIFMAPAEVLAMLDADDDDKLGEVADRFLPRRFRAAAAQ